MTTTRADVTPTIQILFEKLAASVIKIQEKGRVLFIHKDSNLSTAYKITTYSSPVGITDISGTLKQSVIDIFDGNVKKVILFQTKTDMDDVAAQLAIQKFDWMFSDEASLQSAVANWAHTNKKFAVVYNVAKDSEYVVNFVTPSAVLADGTTTQATVALLPYVTGQIAGCPYSRSIMGASMAEQYSNCSEPSSYAEGTCFIEYDDDIECVRFANGYNSLTTVGANQTEDMKKITIAECKMRVSTDLRTAFKKSYQGKYKNTRQNQQLFFDACKYGYFRELEKLGVLDPNYDNNIQIDVEEQRAMWLASGKSEAADWSEEEVRNNTFGDFIVPVCDIKFLDAIESMKMTVKMF